MTKNQNRVAILSIIFSSIITILLVIGYPAASKPKNYLPGDYDNSGCVDEADREPVLTQIANDPGTYISESPYDLNEDGYINKLDAQSFEELLGTCNILSGPQGNHEQIVALNVTDYFIKLITGEWVLRNGVKISAFNARSADLEESRSFYLGQFSKPPSVFINNKDSLPSFTIAQREKNLDLFSSYEKFYLEFDRPLDSAERIAVLAMDLDGAPDLSAEDIKKNLPIGSGVIAAKKLSNVLGLPVEANPLRSPVLKVAGDMSSPENIEASINLSQDMELNTGNLPDPDTGTTPMVCDPDQEKACLELNAFGNPHGISLTLACDDQTQRCVTWNEQTCTCTANSSPGAGCEKTERRDPANDNSSLQSNFVWRETHILRYDTDNKRYITTADGTEFKCGFGCPFNYYDKSTERARCGDGYLDPANNCGCGCTTDETEATCKEKNLTKIPDNYASAGKCGCYCKPDAVKCPFKQTADDTTCKCGCSLEKASECQAKIKTEAYKNYSFNSTECSCECSLNDNSCLDGFRFYKDACKCDCPSETRLDCERDSENNPHLFFKPETCRCACNLQPEQCQAGQEFEKDKCACKCNNIRDRIKCTESDGNPNRYCGCDCPRDKVFNEKTGCDCIQRDYNWTCLGKDAIAGCGKDGCSCKKPNSVLVCDHPIRRNKFSNVTQDFYFGKNFQLSNKSSNSCTCVENFSGTLSAPSPGGAITLKYKDGKLIEKNGVPVSDFGSLTPPPFTNKLVPVKSIVTATYNPPPPSLAATSGNSLPAATTDKSAMIALNIITPETKNSELAKFLKDNKNLKLQYQYVIHYPKGTVGVDKVVQGLDEKLKAKSGASNKVNFKSSKKKNLKLFLDATISKVFSISYSLVGIDPKTGQTVKLSKSSPKVKIDVTKESPVA